jgi:benzylsuccinate CoA-transferase BbsF subunit
MEKLPLAGVTVLDFFWQIAGPLATKALLELGARVIRVESSTRPDNLRLSGLRSGPQAHPGGFKDLNHGGVLHSCNSCKESIAVNLNTPEGSALIKRLIPHVDVVTNNYTAHAMEKWGLTFADVREVNPRIVYISMPAMSTTSPRRDWKASGVQVNAVSGLNTVMGLAGDPPSGPGPIYADFAGNPYHAATAVIAGLELVRRTGHAVAIDIGQYEATAALVGTEMLAETLLGTPTPRLGNRHPWQCPHGVFPVAGWDRWIAIAVGTDQQWTSLASVLDLPRRAEWATFVGRKRDEDALEREIAARTREQDGDALMERLQTASVPAAVVQTMENVVRTDTYLGGEFFRTFVKDGYEYRISGPAFHVEGACPPVGMLADIGADTESVLATLAGLTTEEIAGLRARGVPE